MRKITVSSNLSSKISSRRKSDGIVLRSSNFSRGIAFLLMRKKFCQGYREFFGGFLHGGKVILVWTLLDGIAYLEEDKNNCDQQTCMIKSDSRSREIRHT